MTIPNLAGLGDRRALRATQREVGAALLEVGAALQEVEVTHREVGAALQRVRATQREVGVTMGAAIATLRDVLAASPLHRCAELLNGVENRFRGSAMLAQGLEALSDFFNG